MRGAVTLAVRGFLVCVVLGGLPEVVSLVQLLGQISALGVAYLPMVMSSSGGWVLLMSGAQLLLSLARWRWCWAAWAVWGLLVLQTGLMAVLVTMHEPSVKLYSMEVFPEIVLIWAGWQVLRWGNESGREAAHEVSARPEHEVEQGGVRVLEYASVEREPLKLGTALVFLPAMMLIQAAGLVWTAMSSSGMSVVGFAAGFAATACLVVFVVAVTLSWRAWAKAQRGGVFRRELWAVGGTWFSVLVVASAALPLAPAFVGLLSGSGMGLDSRSLYQLARTVGFQAFRGVGPVVFFMMMVWPAMRGGGVSTPERRTGER